MKQSEAIKILIHANKWRRGVYLLGNDLIDFPMPNPKQFGEAIDFAISELKQNKKLIIDLQSQNHSLRVQLGDIKDGRFGYLNK